MRKTITVILALICVLGMSTACAEFDVSQYTYDELVEIKQAVDARLDEIDRQTAIENADRTISFDDAERVVFVKQTTEQQPVVEIIKDDAPAQTNLIWSTSDPETVTVTATGKVTAIAAGDAVITATAEDNSYLSASYVVHAAIPVEMITVWGPTEPLIISNDPETAIAELGFSVEPEDAYYQSVNWVSSDETIVSVDETGKIHGLKPGKVVITAVSAEDPPAGKKVIQATYDVAVKQLVTALECEEKNLTINVGENTKLNISVLPEYADNRSIQFSSSDPEVASVDKQGVVYAEGCGECDILCETTDGSGVTATCHIRVTKMIKGLNFAEESIKMTVGEVRHADVEISPEDATKKELIWTSTNVFVARVAAGNIEAVGEGDCEITCTTMDGSNISASIKVHIPVFGVDAEEFAVTYSELMTAPEEYEGARICMYGKMLSRTEEEKLSTFTLGTAGDNYTDQVILAKCDPELIPEGTDEGDMVTVYGLFRIEHNFSEGLQAEAAVPVIEAVKIIPDEL